MKTIAQINPSIIELYLYTIIDKSFFLAILSNKFKLLFFIKNYLNLYSLESYHIFLAKKKNLIIFGKFMMIYFDYILKKIKY